MKKSILLFVLGIAVATQTLFAQVPSYVPTNGLVAYYPFNGNANDASGNGNNGVNNGATLTTDRNGNANSAYYFSSSGCATRIDAQINTSSIQNGLTISIWVLRVGNGCQGPRILEFWPSNDPNGLGMAQWGWENGGNSLWIGSTTTDGCYTSVPVNGNNIWYNIVYTHDGSTGKFYRDGVLVASIPSSANPTLAGNASFGRMNHPGYDAFNGNLDDIGIWNRALTQQEITTMYNSVETPNYSDNCNNVSGSLTQGLVGYWPFCGNANDDSGNGNHGIVNGATLTTDRFGNANSAYNFNGTSDFININDNSSMHNQLFSISAWVYGTDFNGFRQILTKNNGTSVFESINLVVNNLPSWKVTAQVGGTGYYGTLLQSPNMISENNWHLICYVYRGIDQTQELYLDGVLVSSNTALTATQYDNKPITLGSQLENNIMNYFFKGKIDDVGIWNRALTQQEVTQLYNQNQCFTNTTVTDTLVINVGQLSFTNPVTYANNITIAPNPASTQITISFNNITDLTGGTINVVNALGQQVATTPITASGTNTSMALNTWGSNGMYYVQIVNANGVVVDVKKIILQ